MLEDFANYLRDDESDELGNYHNLALKGTYTNQALGDDFVAMPHDVHAYFATKYDLDIKVPR